MLPGGVVPNQELSLGGQQVATKATDSAAWPKQQAAPARHFAQRGRVRFREQRALPSAAQFPLPPPGEHVAEQPPETGQTLDTHHEPEQPRAPVQGERQNYFAVEFVMGGVLVMLGVADREYSGLNQVRKPLTYRNRSFSHRLRNMLRATARGRLRPTEEPVERAVQEYRRHHPRPRDIPVCPPCQSTGGGGERQHADVVQQRPPVVAPVQLQERCPVNRRAVPAKAGAGFGDTRVLRGKGCCTRRLLCGGGLGRTD